MMAFSLKAQRDKLKWAALVLTLVSPEYALFTELLAQDTGTHCSEGSLKTSTLIKFHKGQIDIIKPPSLQICAGFFFPLVIAKAC